MENWLSWGEWVHTVRGGFHFAAALLALGLGPIILFRRKGTQSHRWLGRVWFAAMLFVNLSALIMYEMHSRPNLFHFFALMSLAAIIPGFLSIRKYAKTREKRHLVNHQHFMVWGYFGLASAGLWQVGFRIALDLKIFGSIGALYGFFGALTALTGIGLSVYMNRKYPAPTKQTTPTP